MKRQMIPAIAVMILALASCNKQTPAVDTVGEQNKALVKKYMDAALVGNTTDMADLLADNYQGRGPNMKDSVNRQQGLDNWKKNWEEQFSAIKYDEAAVLATTITPETNIRNAGDWVLTWGTASVDYKNGNASAKFFLHEAYRIANGKIVWSIVYYNQADILTQQGFTFVPPAKTDAKM